MNYKEQLLFIYPLPNINQLSKTPNSTRNRSKDKISQDELLLIRKNNEHDSKLELVKPIKK